MKCDKCKGESKVMNVAKDTDGIYRIRECKSCGNRFCTVERKFNDSDGYEAIKQIRNLKRISNARRKTK